MTRESKKYLITAAALTVLFVLFTVLVKLVDVQAVGPQQSEVGLATMNAAMATTIGYNAVFYYIATVLGIFCILIAVCFALMGAAQLFATRDIRRVNYRILAVGGLYVAVVLLYVLFEFVVINYRPVAINDKLSPSYPSTHTLLALTITISAAMILKGVLKNRRLAELLGWVCVGLGVLTVLCRLLSGVHWLTDVIGGMLLSAALLVWFAFALEMLKERHRRVDWD